MSIAPANLGACLRIAREAEELGFSSLWLAEVNGPDALVTLAGCAQNTNRVDLVTGVLPIQIRTPAAMAMAFLTLNELSGGRAVAGLGVSGPVIVERWHGAAYSRPLTAMRECVAIMRQLFTQGRCKFAGKVYRCEFRFGPRLAAPRPPRIFLAALNPPMLRLAGEIADGVLLNYSAPEAVSEMVGEVRAAARAAGRNPQELAVAVYTRMCVTDDERRALDQFKRELATYAFVDSYARMFERHGMVEEFAEVRRLWREGRREEAPGALSDRSVRQMAAFGPASACRDLVARFRQAGVSIPVIFPVVGGPAALDEFTATMRALADA